MLLTLMPSLAVVSPLMVSERVTSLPPFHFVLTLISELSSTPSSIALSANFTLRSSLMA